MSDTLTNKGEAILNLLLSSEQSLTASQMVERDPSINNNTAQSVLRSLLKGGYIEVAEIVYSGKVLCRSYRPTAKASSAAFQELASRFHSLRKNIPAPSIFAGLIDNEEDKLEIIEELEAMIAEKKALLAEEDE